MIILSVGGIFLLENRTHKLWIGEPEPPGLFQTTGNIDVAPVNQDQEIIILVKEFSPIVNSQPPAPAYSNPGGLIDLRLHIEL